MIQMNIKGMCFLCLTNSLKGTVVIMIIEHMSIYDQLTCVVVATTNENLIHQDHYTVFVCVCMIAFQYMIYCYVGAIYSEILNHVFCVL